MKNRFEEETQLEEFERMLQEAESEDDDNPFENIAASYRTDVNKSKDSDQKKLCLSTAKLIINKEMDRVIDFDIEELFQTVGGNDNGLSYVIFFAVHFLAIQGESYIPTNLNYRKTISQFLSMNSLIKFYRTRRDAPVFVRVKIREFFEAIEWTEAKPVQNDEVLERFARASTQCLKFLSSLEEIDAINSFYRYCALKYREQLGMAESHDVDEVNKNHDIPFAHENEEATVEETWPEENHVRWASDDLVVAADKKENATFLRKIFDNNLKPRLAVNEAIFDTLQARFPHFAEVTAFYKAQFRLNMLTGRDYISPVLLLGAPGIGKTIYAKELAQALATGYTFIDMASASASWTLSGLTTSWNGAKPGKLVTAMLESPTASPVVVLDEIEKSGTSGHGQDARTPLYQLLEQNTAKSFTDEFVDYPVDLSRIIYIACANSTEGLTEPLLTRFQIFEIPEPSDDQHGIILESIYQAEVAGTQVFPAHLSNEIKFHLRGQSLRTAKVQISKAISSVLLSMSMEELKSAKPHSVNLSVANFQAKPIKKKSMGF